MTSVICPRCKNHISEWDLICLKCSYAITPEERAKLIKEQEAQLEREQAEKHTVHLAHMKNHHPHQFQIKLDKLSLGTLHVGFDVVTVFLVSVFLLIVAALLMMM